MAGEGGAGGGRRGAGMERTRGEARGEARAAAEGAQAWVGVLCRSRNGESGTGERSGLEWALAPPPGKFSLSVTEEPEDRQGGGAESETRGEGSGARPEIPAGGGGPIPAGGAGTIPLVEPRPAGGDVAGRGATGEGAADTAGGGAPRSDTGGG